MSNPNSSLAAEIADQHDRSLVGHVEQLPTQPIHFKVKPFQGSTEELRQRLDRLMKEQERVMM